MFATCQRREFAIVWPCRFVVAITMLIHGLSSVTSSMAQTDSLTIRNQQPAHSQSLSAVQEPVALNPVVPLEKEVEQRLREVAKASAGRTSWNKTELERIRWSTSEPLPGHVVDLLEKLSGEIRFEELHQLCQWRMDDQRSLVGIPRDEDLRLFVRQIEVAPWSKEQSFPKVVLHTRTRSGPTLLTLVPPSKPAASLPPQNRVTPAGGTISNDHQTLMPAGYVVEQALSTEPRKSP
ncbi:hypothetical protein Spb1_17950 [Planctopirus ephydatiae]|uniref:Uncharacterized protein n=1 Tax=Planctopirus ephydatiae TaxID=2528019 RepID=A0A518GMT6_9PLAN|nr:hypothetical protein [Planctopirus ephydatiae]QDV29876.1 hypothetical protein Spb1_17950 [Planctopirus ephydatiae]